MTHAKMYMNVNTRAVSFYKPQHVENPDMIPYFGELPPLHPTKGLPIVPKEELGPAFDSHSDDVEVVPTIVEPVPDVTEKLADEAKKEAERIIEIADAINDLKQFDFTSAGLPRLDKLTLALGYPVNGKDRDEAFALHLEAKSIED